MRGSKSRRCNVWKIEVQPFRVQERIGYPVIEITNSFIVAPEQLKATSISVSIVIQMHATHLLKSHQVIVFFVVGFDAKGSAIAYNLIIQNKMFSLFRSKLVVDPHVQIVWRLPEFSIGKRELSSTTGFIRQRYARIYASISR